MDDGRFLVLGDEAVALGAIDAGISVAYGYPGTPSTEIIEYVQAYRDREDTSLVARWCSNEKTATEGGVGVSFAGKRCLVTMKHVGLNVAMDAFVNACLMEIHGGLVLAVADDPGMHSSQNEQDTRFLTDFAHTMCLEPKNQQEAYDMTREAFDLSEAFHVPVVVRLVTRLSHARSVISRRAGRAKTDLGKATDRKKWMTLPALARKQWAHLLEQQREFVAWSEAASFNTLDLNPDFRDFGVITSGLGGNYYAENEAELSARPSRLHVATYPLPTGKIRRLAESVARVVLIEEGYPYIERQLRSIVGQAVEVCGKLDGAVPLQGELNADNVRSALGLPERRAVHLHPTAAGAPSVAGATSTTSAPSTSGQPAADAVREDASASSPPRSLIDALPGRPPQLCRGCPHIYSFQALNEAREGLSTSIVTGDIGCYALSALPPYDAVETVLCMGASIGMAKGVAEAGQKNVVATIGDSTFLHSGIPGLIDAVSAGANVTIVILDNGTTAMTGGQDTVAPGSTIRELAIAAGVDPDHVVVIDPVPKKHPENVEVYRRELAYNGVSVVIPVRECVQTALQRARRGTKVAVPGETGRSS